MAFPPRKPSRSLGVLACVAGTALYRRERLFCVIAYLPKATVQAAIGSVPCCFNNKLLNVFKLLDVSDQRDHDFRNDCPIGVSL